MESSPKFPRDPGIQILTKNPVLSFFCKILFGKNENKLKEAVVGPFKNKYGIEQIKDRRTLRKGVSVAIGRSYEWKVKGSTARWV